MADAPQKVTSLNLNPTIPYDPFVVDYMNFFSFVIPEQFNGWVPETIAWHKTCYISANLSYAMAEVTVKGPDAIAFLNHACVNTDFAKMPMNGLRHGIMCTEKGNVIMHGIIVRTGEDAFATYAFSPYIDYLAASGKWDIELLRNEGGDFIYQIGGPTSLQILENAAKCDLHDVKFMRYVNVEIAGCPVRIARQGMAGTLSYEVHGLAKYSDAVYNTIVEVGKDYGLEKLGIVAYQCNHTENGFPNIGSHFPYPFKDDPKLQAYLQSIGFFADPTNMPLGGSLSDSIDDYFRNPFELGWGHMVKFDHDFIGREALERIAQDHREMVTLVWNPDDVADIFRSQMSHDGPHYKKMIFPYDRIHCGYGNVQDRVVDAEGNVIGASMWPLLSEWYHDYISVCSLDKEYAQIGTEVTVLWGDAADEKKAVKATVARYPYLDLPSNAKYPIEEIPHYQG